MAALLASMAVIYVSADEQETPTVSSVTETVNPDGSVTLKEGFVMPSGQNEIYPKETYPFALFVNGEYKKSFKNWNGNTDKDGDFVMDYLLAKKGSYVGAEVEIICRRDYTADTSETDGTPKTDSNATYNFIQLSVMNAAVNIDLNGYTLDLADIALIPLGLKRYASGQKINFNIENGTIKNTKRLIHVYQASDKTGYLPRGCSVSFENVKFDLTSDAMLVYANPNISIFLYADDPSFANADGLSYINPEAENRKYPIGISFTGCSFINSPTTVFSLPENTGDIAITIDCAHSDSNGDAACDLCGYISPVAYVAAAEMGGEFKLVFKSKLASIVKTIAVTTAAGTESIDVATLTSDTDGYYTIEKTLPMDDLSATINIAFLDAEGKALEMVNERGAITTSYTAGVINNIKDQKANGDEDLGASIDALTKELADKTAALEEALANKMDAGDVADSISKLRSDIEKGYKAEDLILAGDIDKVAAELAKLNTALEEAKTAINQAIAAIREGLEEKTAELDAAIATKADNAEMLAKYTELKSAYEAADLVLADNDVALKAADEAMQAAINALKTTLDEQEERISSVETMNTVQLVIIIVVLIVAVAAVILPMVNGKKKENE